jgi:predicted  nucleic acid-binding Zn-ribbon protein
MATDAGLIDQPNERREMTNEKGLRGRVTRQGEEAIGKVAHGLLENPVVTRTLSATFEARERATRAQELAMSALNLPSAGDLERLTRRLRSVSQRLETIEDGLDRVEERIDKLGAESPIEHRLTAIEEVLARIEAMLDERAGTSGGGESEAPTVAQETQAVADAVAAETERRRRSPQS